MRNEVMRPSDGSKDYYISYATKEKAILPGTFDTEDETALVQTIPGTEYSPEWERYNWYILNGDHREIYADLIDQGFDKCYDYFCSKPEQKSSWSN